MDVVLASDEQIVYRQAFNTSIFLFWHNTNFIITSQRIIGEKPTLLLGLIPLGHSQIILPLKKIARISSAYKFHIFRFLLGIFIFLLGINLMIESVLLGSMLSSLAVAILLNCYVATLLISSTSRQYTTIELSYFEKNKILEFISTALHRISAV